MSRPLLPVTPQLEVPKNDFGKNRDALEDKQELPSVEIGNPLDIRTTDDAGGRDRAPEPLFVSSIRRDEPIVTRIELWSYYRQSFFLFPPEFCCGLNTVSDNFFLSVLQWR